MRLIHVPVTRCVITLMYWLIDLSYLFSLIACIEIPRLMRLLSGVVITAHHGELAATFAVRCVDRLATRRICRRSVLV